MCATYFQYQVNLCNFLSAALCRLGEHQLPPQKEFVIGGGFRDGGNAVTVTRGQCREVQALWSSHEEADTRMILHAKYAARTDRRLVIQSPHTDVLILSVSQFRSLGCPELWFRLKDREQMIPVHHIAHALGEELYWSLLGFHAIKGCNSTSVLAGIGKKKTWDSFCRSTNHQNSVSDLGEEQELNVTTASICEAFVCSPYTTSKKASTVDELHNFMFCQKKQKNEKLPSMSDCLIQHLKQSNYQAFIWRHALEAMQDLESPEGHGWVRDEKHLLPLLMKKAPAPESLLDLKTCKCKMSSSLRNCSCNNTGLSCTEGCYCMANDEECKNLHGVTCICDSEESNKEWKASRTVELFDVWHICSIEQIYKGRNIAISNLLYSISFHWQKVYYKQQIL